MLGSFSASDGTWIFKAIQASLFAFQLFPVYLYAISSCFSFIHTRAVLFQTQQYSEGRTYLRNSPSSMITWRSIGFQTFLTILLIPYA